MMGSAKQRSVIYFVWGCRAGEINMMDSAKQPSVIYSVWGCLAGEINMMDSAKQPWSEERECVQE